MFVAQKKKSVFKCSASNKHKTQTMSEPLAIPVTLQSTGTARRWAITTLNSARDKRDANKIKASEEMEKSRLPGFSPLHGPLNVTGTLPRRRRRHLTGSSATATSTTATPQHTARWRKAHPWIPNEKVTIIDPSRVWECPRRHAAPKGVPIWQTAQLRTRLLEPNDPLPVHTNRNKLMSDLHKTKCHAHPSYDLDGDGVVSIDDYKLAKDMDTDGSGHIDEEETRLGRIKLARNFFEMKNQVTSRYHRKDWREMDKQSAALVKEKHFGRSLKKLQKQLTIGQQRGGRDVIDSLTNSHFDHPSARYGSGATSMARSQSISGMKALRKRNFIRDAQSSCEPGSWMFQPEVRYGRQSLITDMKLANRTALNGDVLRKWGEDKKQNAQQNLGSSRGSNISSSRGSNTARKHLFGAG